MAEQPPVLQAWLTAGKKRITVQAAYASRYSVWVEGNGDSYGPEIENLEISLNDKLIQIGRCRVLPGRNGERARRLVAVGRTHDFEKLFFHAKIETLESAAANLPLIFGYKNSIDPAFRNFVSDLTYDLNVFINVLDEMDGDCRDEPPEVQEIIQRSIIGSVGKDLQDYMEKQIGQLDRVVGGFSEKEHEHHGFYFRRQLWNVLLRAPIMARTNLKPRGYNGDSEMMRMIYLDDYQGETTFGKIMHKFSVDQAAAQAVRNRRFEVADLLHRFTERFSPPGSEKLRILSVACGPAFEVRDILRTPADCARLHFSFFDQDQQALLEAAGLVSDIEKSLKTEVSADFIRESVRTMLVTRALQEKWGQFHFIYSMGLFDYLTAPVAAAVLKKLYQLLTPGGEAAIGNFYVVNPSRFYMEYWHDWKIIYRTKDDFVRLVDELPGAKVSVKYDATRIQMLLHVRKETHGVG
jgi:extracellular factor (EF) 3-hydroxypalmitic acid methyl ester biosynthesis protein